MNDLVIFMIAVEVKVNLIDFDKQVFN